MMPFLGWLNWEHPDIITERPFPEFWPASPWQGKAIPDKDVSGGRPGRRWPSHRDEIKKAIFFKSK
jgi:hypothetical protein